VAKFWAERGGFSNRFKLGENYSSHFIQKVIL
jgi:hypothetical protein